jgi:hypothetical protein
MAGDQALNTGPVGGHLSKPLHLFSQSCSNQALTHQNMVLTEPHFANPKPWPDLYHIFFALREACDADDQQLLERFQNFLRASESTPAVFLLLSGCFS